MGITLLKNNVPWGPFTRAQIQEGLARGDFTLQVLAHAPGVKEWLPLGEVLDHVDRSTTLPPLPVSRELPPTPTAPPVPSVRPSPPILPTPPMQPAPPILHIPEKPPVELKAASFLPRGIAFLIDCAILFLPIVVLFALGALTLEIQGWWQQADHESMHQEWELLKRNFHQLVLLVAVGLGWLYAAGLESSRWQATVGKQWMGMKVTDSQGERISFSHATKRHLAKYLSALPCFLGFIFAIFSSRGLAWHDRLADTRVVRK